MEKNKTITNSFKNIMFNKFFKGTIDDLLKMVSDAPTEEINKINNPDEILNPDEAIATVMDDLKVSKEEAERIVTELQIEEFDKIARDLVDKGIIEIVDYDIENGYKYMPTEKGLAMLKNQT